MTSSLIANFAVAASAYTFAWVLYSSNLAVAVTAGAYAWVLYSKMKWTSSIKAFREAHHGYKTSDSTTKHVLLIVNPACGGGKAMQLYPKCLAALERQGYEVEVYVTQSAHDMITLSYRRNLARYTNMICMLAGDSSLYEMVQAVLRQHEGKWPHAPILQLPGGSSNALSGDFHGYAMDAGEIISNATIVKKGSVLECTCEGATTRYSLHNAFDGVQRFMCDAITTIRPNLYPAFGKPIVYLYILLTLLRIPWSQFKDQTPFIMTVLNSDQEGDDIDLGFGVDRFDDKLIILYQEHYMGLKQLFCFLQDEFSGELGQQYRDNKSRRRSVNQENVSIVDVRKSFVLQGDGHYKIYSDGSEMLPIEGESIKFEVIPNAIPYFVMGKQM